MTMKKDDDEEERCYNPFVCTKLQFSNWPILMQALSMDPGSTRNEMFAELFNWKDLSIQSLNSGIHMDAQSFREK